ncbi:NAD(P)-dependent oxidoreductase [Armatimonas sp.]|uniref:NAD(P)-dependent oxidoreductase n=1 Tax=Armatimonas sp. TaxID=1872638 RepID=UPI003753BAE3
MQIVVTAAYAYEHEEYAALVRLLPEFELTSKLTPDAPVLCVTSRDFITAELLNRLPGVKLIATRSTGFEHIDLVAANARGITVCNVPHYGDHTVAEFAFALMLMVQRGLRHSLKDAEEGRFPFGSQRGFDLFGQTLGIIGTGRIGRRTAQIGVGFGMSVLAHDIAPLLDEAVRIGYSYVGLEELLSRADILTLHVPLTSRTHHLIGAAELAKLRRGAVLINTARGGVVDTSAVLAALDSGQLSGAGLDVLEDEERIAEIAPGYLARFPSLILTPHMAYHTTGGVGRIRQTTAENIRAFLGGAPQNTVSLL